MTASFATTTTELMAKLGLPPPRSGAMGRVDLRVDGVSVEMTEAADGRGIVVRGSPGRLSDHPPQRGDQIRRLLRDALGLMPSSLAAVVLEPDAAGQPRIVALATYAYRFRQVGRLVEAVEDVVEACERFAPLLRQANDRGDDPGRRFAATETLIFRP